MGAGVIVKDQNGEVRVSVSSKSPYINHLETAKAMEYVSVRIGVAMVGKLRI